MWVMTRAARRLRTSGDSMSATVTEPSLKMDAEAAFPSGLGSWHRTAITEGPRLVTISVTRAV